MSDSKEIRCPKCGEVFSVDENLYSNIVKQIKDKEYAKDIESQKLNAETEKKLAVANAVSDMQKQLAEKQAEITKLQNDLKANKELAEKDKNLAVKDIESQWKSENDKLINNNLQLVNKLQEKENEFNSKVQELKDEHKKELEEKQGEVNYFKNLKQKLSTKMIGESLERHCEDEFNKIRMAAFPNAEFGKDNDITYGSKGDYIFREEKDGVELVSIMFEMKNENEETATKKKNEDFFKELDKDRRQKNCEYAVLVSLLERDSDYYNEGIVDVSYKYEKMYVIRPQFFIPMISILRNASLRSYEDKKALATYKNQNIDITNFEDSVKKVGENISNDYRLAHEKFGSAIDDIDKTIDRLKKIKEELLSSERHLRLASEKVEDLSIKKLTKDNPTMKEMFDNIKDGE